MGNGMGEKKLCHVQIRVTETEKKLISQMRSKGMTSSALFRKSLHDYCKENGITVQPQSPEIQSDEQQE